MPLARAVIACITLVGVASIPDEALSSCFDRQAIEDRHDKQGALFTALECLEEQIDRVNTQVSNLKVPSLRIGEPKEQKIGKWVEIEHDGFLQVRVGGSGGATGQAWCNDEPNKGGNRIRKISGFTSDILIVTAGSWCLVEMVESNKQGGGVTAWHFPLSAN